MNFRTTYILFGILGAMLLTLGLVLWIGPSTAPPKGYIFPSAHEKGSEVTPDNVTRVVIEGGDSAGEKIVFVRAGEGDSKDRRWVMKEPISSPVDRFAVETLVREVLDARKDDKAELSKNLKQWGLDSPRRVVTLEGGGKTFELKVGDTAGAGSDAVVYVLSSEYAKTPMAVLRSELSAADTYDLDQFRSRDLLAVSDSDIGSISARTAKGEPVVLESVGGHWNFVKPASYGPADPEGASGDTAGKAPTGVRQLLTDLVALKVDAKTDTAPDKKPKAKTKKDTGFVENKASEASQKKYGLESEKTAELVLTVKRSPSAKEATTLLIGKKADDKGEQYYARLASDHNVVKVSGKNLEPIRKFLAHPEEMRDHNLVRLPDKPDVIRIKRSGDEGVELVRSAAGGQPPHGGFHGLRDLWKVYLGSDKKGLAADLGAVDALTKMLLGQRQVREFPKGKPEELGLAHPEVTVSLWVNGIKPAKKEDKKEDKGKEDKKKDKKKEEPKKDEDRPQLRSDTPDVLLEFGRVRDGLVAVRRKTGKDLKDVSIVKVPEDIFKQVDRGPLAYLEKTLPPLLSVNSTDLRKITLDLDGKMTEIARKDAFSPWLFEKPSNLKGRKADNKLVEDLFNNAINNVLIQGWQALKPKDTQLTDWGLKPPLSQAKVSYVKDGKTQTKALWIGKETPDHKGFYARQSDSERVFIVAKTEVEKLKQPLLDLTVFDFKADDVKTVKLTVKPKPLKANMLELERKSAKEWTALKPAGVKKINAELAEDLVKSLEHLKAEKFVDVKAGGKGGYDLEVKQGALEIEIVLKSKPKEKLTLTVGKAEGVGSFYAASNKQPGAVFLIGKGERDVLDKVKNDLASLVAE